MSIYALAVLATLFFWVTKEKLISEKVHALVPRNEMVGARTKKYSEVPKRIDRSISTMNTVIFMGGLISSAYLFITEKMGTWYLILLFLGYLIMFYLTVIDFKRESEKSFWDYMILLTSSISLIFFASLVIHLVVPIYSFIHT
jgi:hypothetical protein